MRHMHQVGPVRVGVIGATGYSGIELLYLLERHPGVELAFAASDQRAGQTLRDVIGSAGSQAFCTRDQARALLPELAKSPDSTLFLATPADVSREWMGMARELGLRVVDLSGAYRLRDQAEAIHHYARFDGAETYGLPELFREQIRGARMISNPGCYATAVALALAPVVKAELVDPGLLFVSAVSGISGAGRKATEEFSFVSIANDVRAYRVMAHQHEPEIAQTVAAYAGAAVSLTFTPHLVPIERGILATSNAVLRAGVTEAQIREAFISAYGSEPMVDLGASASDVRLADVVGTNRIRIGFSVDAAKGRVVVTSAIDNLIKGAAGQAIQNFNLMHGFEETAALSSLRRFQS